MADSIPAAKRAFLSSQVRILSAPLAEPEGWRSVSRLREDEQELPEEVVHDVLTRVNAALRKHNTRAFPPAALAHVAAQIDALYLSDVASAPQSFPNQDSSPAVLADGVVQRGADLTDSEVIAALPEAWAEEGEKGETHKAKRQKRSARSRVSDLESYSWGRDYEGLLTTLRELDGKRQSLQRKQKQIEKLRELMVSLEDPAVNVQPNLISAAGRGKVGELEAEMERMRRLAGRVGGMVETMR